MAPARPRHLLLSGPHPALYLYWPEPQQMPPATMRGPLCSRRASPPVPGAARGRFHPLLRCLLLSAQAQLAGDGAELEADDAHALQGGSLAVQWCGRCDGAVAWGAPINPRAAASPARWVLLAPLVEQGPAALPDAAHLRGQLCKGLVPKVKVWHVAAAPLLVALQTEDRHARQHMSFNGRLVWANRSTLTRRVQREPPPYVAWACIHNLDGDGPASMAGREGGAGW